jgi:hypothetical protein
VLDRLAHVIEFLIGGGRITHYLPGCEQLDFFAGGVVFLGPAPAHGVIGDRQFIERKSLTDAEASDPALVDLHARVHAANVLNLVFGDELADGVGE